MRTGERAAAGFTYVIVLVWVALVGLGLGVTGELWRTTAQREREQELLFVGEEFRRAITSYYETSPGVRRFPSRLDVLLQDGRFPTTRRHLRKIYPDPMTGKAEWGLVRQPDGSIVGVRSLSTARPLRTAGYSGLQEAFNGKLKYSDWIFQSPAAVAAAAAAPAVSAPTFGPPARPQAPVRTPVRSAR